MAYFTEVLKSKNFFFLWLGQIISQFGDRLNQMAMIALVYQRAPGSSLELAKIISFTIIPVFVIGPVAGVYVDRWDRRRTMYVCDSLRCVLVLLIPLLFFYKQSMLPIYIVVFLVFCVGRFFVPAKMSVVPDLVDEKNLLLANSLINTTGMIAAALGFGLSGLIISWIGPKSGFYLDSVSFFISAILIFLIGKKINHEKKESLIKMGKDVLEVIQKSVMQEIKEGIFYLVKNKDLRYTIFLLFLLWGALGSIYTVIIVFVQGSLHSATKDLGFLVMFLGLGLFFGSLIYGKFGHKLSLFRTIFLSLISSGSAIVIFALLVKSMPSFLLASALAIVLGLVVSPIMAAGNTLIHQVTHDEMRGKVFSSLEFVMHLAFLLCMLLSALFADQIGEMKILISVGIILIITGIWGFLFGRMKRQIA